MGHAQEIDSRASAMENFLSDEATTNTALGSAFALSNKAKDIARRGLRRQAANNSKAQSRTRRRGCILTNLDKYLDRDETDTTTTTETGSSGAEISDGSSGNIGGLPPSDSVRRGRRLPPRRSSTSLLEDHEDVGNNLLIDQLPVPMRSSSAPSFPASLDLSSHSQPSLRRPSRPERKLSKEEGSLSLSSHEIGSASKAIRSKQGYALPKKHQSLSSRKAAFADSIPTRTNSYQHRSAGVGLRDFIDSTKSSLFPQPQVGDVSVSSAPALSTRRRGVQRRGSVTKYSLEDNADSSAKDSSTKPSTERPPRLAKKKSSRRNAINNTSIESTQEGSTADPKQFKTKRSTKRSSAHRSKPRSRRSTPLQRQQGGRKSLEEGLKSLESSDDESKAWSHGGEQSVASEPALQGRGRHDRRRFMRRGGSASISTDSIETMTKKEVPAETISAVTVPNKTTGEQSEEEREIGGEKSVASEPTLQGRSGHDRRRFMRRGGSASISTDSIETMTKKEVPADTVSDVTVPGKTTREQRSAEERELTKTPTRVRRRGAIFVSSLDPLEIKSAKSGTSASKFLGDDSASASCKRPPLNTSKAKPKSSSDGPTIDLPERKQEGQVRPVPRKQNSKTTRRSSVIKGYLEDEQPLAGEVA